MELIKHNRASVILRFVLKRSDTGQGLTGLTHASSGLRISTITDVEAAPVAYTAAGGTIETIAALGTYAAPTATKCRFKEVSATNHPGLYEIQLADARFAVADARVMVVTVSGATDLLETNYQIALVAYDPYRGSGVTVAPLVNTQADQTFNPTNVRIFASTAEPRLVWPQTDDDGVAVDVSNWAITLTVVREDGTTYLTLTKASGGLIVTGDDDNQITDQRTAAQVSEPGTYTYTIKRTDAGYEQVLRAGTWEIATPP